MKSVPDYRRFLWIQNICLSIFFLGLSIGYVSSIYNQPFSHFLAQLIHSLYNGSFNLMPANKTGPFYSYEYYYATFLLTSICSLFSFLVWRKKISVSLSAFCRESVIISAFCLFFITASLQAIPFLYSNGRDIFIKQLILQILGCR